MRTFQQKYRFYRSLFFAECAKRANQNSMQILLHVIRCWIFLA